MGKRISLWVAVPILLALFAGMAWLAVTRWHPSAQDYPIQGILVDDADGALDWPMLAAVPADFAYIRATMGSEARDPRFAFNWLGSAAAGVRRGVLHAYSLCQLADDQARNLVTTVPRGPDALPAVVSVSFDEGCDARPDRAVLVGELGRFIAAVETHMGKPVLLRETPEVAAQYHLSNDIARPTWSVGRFFPPSYAARPWRVWEATDLRRTEGAEGPLRWLAVAP